MVNRALSVTRDMSFEALIQIIIKMTTLWIHRLHVGLGASRMVNRALPVTRDNKKYLKTVIAATDDMIKLPIDRSLTFFCIIVRFESCLLLICGSLVRRQANASGSGILMRGE
jgi:hypothetical protein